MEKLIKSNKKGIILMLLSSICVCIGQLLCKLSTSGNIILLLGFFFYGIGALIMIVAYRFGELSVLQPMLSLNYILSIFLAVIILKEEITILKVIGVFVIITGVIMIARGDDWLLMYYLILIIMTLIGAIASLYLKKASNSEGMLNIIKNINLYIGGILYLISAILNIYILKFLDYSIVLPLTSVTYIWTMILSYFKLNEKINKKKIIGVILIIIGAILVSIK